MDGSNGLRRKDTTKGPPLRILSLDGGGVRGYSMMIILRELMHHAFVETEGRAPKLEEIPKPCEYFDLIAGTGTGGLIAIMLGRLRLDLETCMNVYVRMTRKVFETDKTIAGIPYKTTLFKASKLEEAIRECVKEHTIFDDEGNDGTAAGGREFQDLSPTSAVGVKRSMSIRSTNTVGISSPGSRTSMLAPGLSSPWGNANASLYDGREERTKTAVTAVFQDTPKNGSSVLLRSYDSRKEPPLEPNCTIWQAGRATCATGLAFKPIKIGQSVFHDNGAGKYNPSPQILEEAAVNEWPGRDVGLFVSIGTGKRPGGTTSNQHEWWEGFVGSSVGNFAEARRNLMRKIEGCEDTHIDMLNTQLAKRGVPRENYCRLNVEVGVGEFGMNEWDRLSEMTTGTRRYLDKPDVREIVHEAAVKMAKIELTKRRIAAHGHGRAHSRSEAYKELPATPVQPPHAFAVELPGNDIPIRNVPLRNTPPQSRGSSNPSTGTPYSYSEDYQTPEKFVVPSNDNVPSRVSVEMPYRRSADDYPRYDRPQRPVTPDRSEDGQYGRAHPPPRPPKTPINDPGQQHYLPRPNGNPRLPYPDNDGPPPIVNKFKKPEFSAR